MSVRLQHWRSLRDCDLEGHRGSLPLLSSSELKHGEEGSHRKEKQPQLKYEWTEMCTCDGLRKTMTEHVMGSEVEAKRAFCRSCLFLGLQRQQTSFGECYPGVRS